MERFFDTKTHRMLCILLCAALIAMLLPLGSLPLAELTDPIGDGPLPPIEALMLGEGEQTVTETTPSTEPLETQPPETRPQEPDTSHQDTGDGQEGQEDGIQGSEGGEEAALDLALVMRWYRYGSQKATIVCGPGDSVQKSLNTAQLLNGDLRYHFDLTGELSPLGGTLVLKPGDNNDHILHIYAEDA